MTTLEFHVQEMVTVESSDCIFAASPVVPDGGHYSSEVGNGHYQEKLWYVFISGAVVRSSSRRKRLCIIVHVCMQIHMCMCMCMLSSC